MWIEDKHRCLRVGKTPYVPQMFFVGKRFLGRLAQAGSFRRLRYKISA